jgi:hypothetical protein
MEKYYVGIFIGILVLSATIAYFLRDKSKDKEKLDNWHL